MSALVSKCVLWFVWGFFALFELLGAIYLPIKSSQDFNGLFAAGMVVIPVVLCGGLRFWIAHIQNVWLIQIPYFFGVVFAYSTGTYGNFLIPQLLHPFQILSALLFLLYLPLFVKFPTRSMVPPLPGGR